MQPNQPPKQNGSPPRPAPANPAAPDQAQNVPQPPAFPALVQMGNARQQHIASTSQSVPSGSQAAANVIPFLNVAPTPPPAAMLSSILSLLFGQAELRYLAGDAEIIPIPLAQRIYPLLATVNALYAKTAIVSLKSKMRALLILDEQRMAEALTASYSVQKERIKTRVRSDLQTLFANAIDYFTNQHAAELQMLYPGNSAHLSSKGSNNLRAKGCAEAGLNDALAEYIADRPIQVDLHLFEFLQNPIALRIIQPFFPSLTLEQIRQAIQQTFSTLPSAAYARPTSQSAQKRKRVSPLPSQFAKRAAYQARITPLQTQATARAPLRLVLQAPQAIPQPLAQTHSSLAPTSLTPAQQAMYSDASFRRVFDELTQATGRLSQDQQQIVQALSPQEIRQQPQVAEAVEISAIVDTVLDIEQQMQQQAARPQFSSPTTSTTNQTGTIQFSLPSTAASSSTASNQVSELDMSLILSQFDDPDSDS